MDILDEKGIAYDSCPGVSSFLRRASALNLEYTLRDFSERDHYKDGKEELRFRPKHSVLCGSSGVHGDLFKHRNAGRAVKKTGSRAVIREDTPAAIVYKATWPDEKKFICTVGTLAKTAADNNITKTAR